MQAEIKEIVSPDIIDFKNYYPSNEICFSFLIQITVGVKGEDGGDIFNVEICTPQWLLQDNKNTDVLLGRGKLIVFEYDIDRILKRVTDYCNSTIGENCQEIVNRISKMAIWEFEDYRNK